MTITSEGIDQRPELKLLATACRRIFSIYAGHVAGILVTTSGVQLRLTEQNRERVVQSLLDCFGYAVHAGPDANHEQTLVVTGWSYEALAQRAARTEEAVRQLVDEKSQVPIVTLHAYLAYVTTYGYSEDDARDETIDAAQRNAATRLASLGQPHDVLTDDDIRHAPAELADLLNRIQVAHEALEQAKHDHTHLAAAAIERFRQLRAQGPGQPDEAFISIVHNERNDK